MAEQKPTVPADAPKAEPSAKPAATGKPGNKPNAVVRGTAPTVPADAPLYRVTKRAHFLNGRVVEAGETVRYAGVPGELLEPLDAAAKAARKEADEARAKRKAAAAEQASTTAKLRKLLAQQ